MSCQKVLSLLSSYLDGEVEGADAEYVSRHLAECASCACELEMLRRMTGLLQANAEVEPPVCLLEQIEAATVRKTGLLESLRSGFARVPQYAQWAGAGLAAAAVLIVLLFAQPKNEQVVRQESSKPLTRPPVVVVTPAPTDSPGLKSSVKPNRMITITERRRRRTRPTFVASNLRPASAPKQPVPGGATSRPNPPPEEVNEALPTSEDTAAVAEPETPTGSETGGAPGTAVAAKVPDEQPAEKKVETPRKTSPQEDPSAMDQLKAKLAAKNKQKYEVKEEPVAGKKHSVPLVGFRF